MSYLTYFKGELDIQLNETHLNELKTYLSQNFEGKEVIVVEENSLVVDDEWKNGSLMEKVVLFIQEHGQLNSGRILCEGEDPKDIWEIIIVDNKPMIRELGKVITYSRAMFKDSVNSIPEFTEKV